uniref:Uncharacterized protein n=1 Tax=Anopheles culicifacies TaxID=139723 RepID=A0A182M457_9DIPT
MTLNRPQVIGIAGPYDGWSFLCRRIKLYVIASHRLTCAGSGESRSSSDTEILFGVSVVRECVTRPLSSEDFGSSESLHSSTSTSTSSSASDSRSTDEFCEPTVKHPSSYLHLPAHCYHFTASDFYGSCH